MSARIIPSAVLDVQIRASDPDVSAWVAANAGSGKTHVLAQRVIRLLLSGVDPSKILCITFTKAAAANMANRVFDELSKWATLDDILLDAQLRKLGLAAPAAAQRAQARRLFARALETPGGLKVQTIHAFCTRLLHQFPFEANVAARFTVLDDAAESQLREQLSLKVLLEAAAAPDSTLGRALASAISSVADQTFRDVVGEAIRERDALREWKASAGSLDAMIAQLSHALGVAAADTVEGIEAEYFASVHIPVSEWLGIVETLAQGSKSDADQRDRLFTAHGAVGRERIDAYLSVFCTKELEPRKNVVTKAIAKDHPELVARLVAEQGRVCALLAHKRAIECRDRTAALLTIADTVLTRYDIEKNRRGLLDYDDLIERTLAMLDTVNPSWVHYKLDYGIDHMLIDEAQDTSPKQWRIVSALVSEFAAGAGLRPRIKRTVFAVGDEKQSIFSFQGAEPSQFDAMRRTFEQEFNAPEFGWRHERFAHSFRSGANVLGAVDRVFADQAIYTSITSDTGGQPVHTALPDAAPGVVEVWDLFKPEDKRELEGWDAPFDTVTETSPLVRLAEKITASIAAWRRKGARPGDVLVLVRQRGALFETIIRTLKSAGIPVAGADRLVLTGHIAVMDLMILADALLLQNDDLALATVLKSPLFGLNEQQLFTLAWNRGGKTLLMSLREKSSDDPAFSGALATFERLAQRARHDTPFAFYAHVLGREGGRKAFLARLGVEASDALDEFLNLALDYENRETPSLQGFVAWLRQAKSEVKRDMEMGRDEVRVMTVHGAKGLEAPIVILADTTTRPEGSHPPRLLALPAANAPPGTPDRIVWAGAKTNDIGPMADARDGALRAARDEYRRLLYVAMTRAAERLVICGVEGRTKPPEGCWYELVTAALADELVEEASDDGDGVVKRYRKFSAEEIAAEPAASVPLMPIVIPDWLHDDAPDDPKRPAFLSPSKTADDGDARVRLTGESAIGREAALERGRIVHRLLQSLPDIAPEKRAEAGQRHLARLQQKPQSASKSTLSAQDAHRILTQVLHLLAKPRFGELFGPRSRAEVPIVGRLNGIPVAGQVDRLCVTETAVLIADYKTNRPAPKRIEDVPPAYIRQLALYRAVLQSLYPGHTIRAALVWTEVPDLMEISPELLDAARAAVTST